MNDRPDRTDTAKSALADRQRDPAVRRQPEPITHPYAFTNTNLQALLDRSRGDFIDDIGEMISDILLIKKTIKTDPLDLDTAWLAFVAHRNASFAVNKLPPQPQTERRAVFDAILSDVLNDTYLKPHVKR